MVLDAELQNWAPNVYSYQKMQEMNCEIIFRIMGVSLRKMRSWLLSNIINAKQSRTSES